MNIYERIAQNKRATWIVLTVFILFFLILGLGFDYFYGVGFEVPLFSIIALFIGIVFSYAGYRHGDKLILSSTHARELNLAEPKERQWQNVVEEVSIASGITLPKTYVIEDADPNAFATGRSPEYASIAVTTGLLDALNRDQLQAVAAHETSHIKNFDIRLMLVLASLVGAIALLSDWAGRSLFRSDRRDKDKTSSLTLVVLIVWLFSVILAPLLSQIMAMCVSRKREYLADATGAELTRNPLALAEALEKIESYKGPTRSVNQGTAHLCISDPKGSALTQKDGWFANLFSTHPPLHRRIEALEQMAYVK